MSIIFTEGFDYLPVGPSVQSYFSSPGKWDGIYGIGGSSSSLSGTNSVTPYNYGNALLMSALGLQKSLGSNLSGVYCHFNFQYSAVTGGASITNTVFRYLDGSTVQVEVILIANPLSGTAAFEFRNGAGTLLWDPPSEFDMNAGKYYSVEIDVNFDPTNGYVYLTLWDISANTGYSGEVPGGLDTAPSGNSWSNGVVLGPDSTYPDANQAQFYYDDFWIGDAGDFSSCRRVYSVFPTGDVSNSGWSTSNGGSIFSALSGNPTSFTPNVQAGTSGGAFVESFPNITATVIFAAAVTVAAKAGSPGVITADINGTEYDGTAFSGSATTPARYQGQVIEYPGSSITVTAGCKVS